MTEVSKKQAADGVDLLARTFLEEPDQIFDRMRHEAPVQWNDGLDAWVLTAYGDVDRVIRDPSFSVDRGGAITRGGSDASQSRLAACNSRFARWMVFSDPPRHTRLRAAVAAPFQARRMEQLRPKVDDVVAEALDALPHAGGCFELMESFATVVPVRVTAAALGVEEAAWPRLKRWTEAFFAFFGAGIASREVVDDAHGSLRECEAYFGALLSRRRAHPAADLASQIALSTAHDLDESERVELCMTLLAGAYETTSHAIANAVLLLLRNPEQLDRLRRNPALLKGTVEEALRYDGPALSVVRRATRTTEIGGVEIRAGDRVYCMLHAANRDPARFTCPEQFDIGRGAAGHLTFGKGPHFCLGAALSRLEIEVALSGLVGRLRGLRLADPNPERSATLSMRGIKAMHLAFDERLPRRATLHSWTSKEGQTT